MKTNRRMASFAIGTVGVLVLLGCRDAAGPSSGPGQAQPQFDPQVLAVEEKLGEMARGIQRYREDVGEFPNDLAELLSSEAQGWKGPYFGTGAPAAPGSPGYSPQDQMNDPWGSPYVLVVDTEPPKVLSHGPDKAEGTEDDIVVEIPPGE